MASGGPPGAHVEIVAAGFMAALGTGYLFLVALFRFLGRRALAELSPVDLVVMLCLGSAVETALSAPTRRWRPG